MEIIAGYKSNPKQVVSCISADVQLTYYARKEDSTLEATFQQCVDASQLSTKHLHHVISPENSKKIGTKEVSVDNQQAVPPQVHPQPMQHVLSPVSSIHLPNSPKQQEINGPWSLHWLSQKPICEGGNVFTTTLTGGVNRKVDMDSHDLKSLPSKNKKGGAVNYPIGFMKKVARMSASERKQILKILKKHKSKRRVKKGSINSKAAAISSSESSKNSSSSVNKDWENWVLVRGKATKVAEDVKEIGRVVGLTYECETKNCFNLLTKEGRREWRTSGSTD